MIPYDTFFLDLYGTLVNIHTDEKHLNVWKRLSFLLAEHGAEWNPEELRKAFFQEVELQMRKNPAKYPEIDVAIVFSKLFEKRSISPSDQMINATAWSFRAWSTTHLRLYAGAKDFLNKLRRYGKVILLSNAQRLFTIPELQKLEIDDAFDDVLLSSDYGCKKPDLAFFERALQKAGSVPERCLMIGNDSFCDIEGAREAGMDTYYIQSALSPQAHFTDIKATYSQKGMDLRRVYLTIIRGKHAYGKQNSF